MINIPATIILIGGFFLLMAFKIPVTFSMLLSAAISAATSVDDNVITGRLSSAVNAFSPSLLTVHSPS